MLEEQTLAKAAPCTPPHPSVAGRPSAIRAASPWEEQTCHMESRSFGEIGVTDYQGQVAVPPRATQLGCFSN